jgi:hypothetical protein
MCLLDVLKNDFVDVDESMFQGVEKQRDVKGVKRRCEIMGLKKRLLLNRLSDVLSRRMCLRTHNLLSERLKKRLL